jgi:hypothetical protein
LIDAEETMYNEKCKRSFQYINHFDVVNICVVLWKYIYQKLIEINQITFRIAITFNIETPTIIVIITTQILPPIITMVPIVFILIKSIPLCSTMWNPSLPALKKGMPRRAVVMYAFFDKYSRNFIEPECWG